MKNKQFPSPESALRHMVGDISHVFSGKEANFRQYSAVALGAVFTAFVLAAAWQMISPASHASIGIPDQNQVKVGHVKLKTVAPTITEDQDILDATETDLDILLDPELQAIQSQYGDLLEELNAKYSDEELRNLITDPATISEGLDEATQQAIVTPTQSEPVVTQPVKKPGFFQKIWSGIVGIWKKTFNISLATSPAFAATENEACFAGKNMTALSNVMLKTSSRIKELKTTLETADKNGREVTLSELDKLSGLAKSLQTAFDKAEERVNKCMADREAIATKTAAAKNEADEIAAKFKQDDEVSAWMNRSGVALNITAQGDVVATKNADTSSDLGGLIRPRLSAADFSAEDLQTLTRVMSLVKNSGIGAELDSDLQTRSENLKSRSTTPTPSSAQRSSSNGDAAKEKAGVVLSRADGLSVSESGTSDSFKISLKTQPQGNVVISFTANPATEITVTKSITFTNKNWNAPQNVYVAGSPDKVEDGDKPFKVYAKSVSSDQEYDGILIPYITGVNLNVHFLTVPFPPPFGPPWKDGPSYQ